MFATTITNFKLSQVAAVVQSLLELHGAGGSVGTSAAKLANKLVAQTHAEEPKLFEGRLGKRPHKLTFAAAVLANGVLAFRYDRAEQRPFALALGAVLLEVTGKPGEYPLTSNDHALLSVAQGVYLAAAAET